MEEEVVCGCSTGGYHDGGYVPVVAAGYAPGGVVREHGLSGVIGLVLRHGDYTLDSLCGDYVYASARALAVSEFV